MPHSQDGPSRTPRPPYTAVIFTSLHSEDTEGYVAMAERMASLASRQPGYLGLESARSFTGDGIAGLGITVSYWESPADARAWKHVSDHLGAQRIGRERWYSRYVVRIAEVTQEYSHP